MIVRNRDFAVMWMVTISLEVLMCVSGLDMQDSAYQVIPQADHRIEEGHFIGRQRSCEFDSGLVTVEIYYEDS